jgi:hypothetical protein
VGGGQEDGRDGDLEPVFQKPCFCFGTPSMAANCSFDQSHQIFSRVDLSGQKINGYVNSLCGFYCFWQHWHVYFLLFLAGLACVFSIVSGRFGMCIFYCFWQVGMCIFYCSWQVWHVYFLLCLAGLACVFSIVSGRLACVFSIVSGRFGMYIFYCF